MNTLFYKKKIILTNLSRVTILAQKQQKMATFEEKNWILGPRIHHRSAVQHETCSTIFGTPVQAILDQKNLTGLAGGGREGQNNAFEHISHWSDPNVP